MKRDIIVECSTGLNRYRAQCTTILDLLVRDIRRREPLRSQHSFRQKFAAMRQQTQIRDWRDVKNICWIGRVCHRSCPSPTGCRAVLV